MKNVGWLRLWRALRDHWIWQDPEKLRAWLDLLIEAKFKDCKEEKNGRLVNVARGQIFTSQKALAATWGWDRKTVKAFLDLLRADEMIDFVTNTSGATGYTLITIRNYDHYQVDDDEALDTILPTRSPLDFPKVAQNLDTTLPTRADILTARGIDSIQEARTLERTLERALAPHSLPSALPTEVKKLRKKEVEAKTETQQKNQKQQLAPQNGAAKSAQAVQVDGLLPGVAVALEALEVPTPGSAARPAGPATGSAAAPGAPDPVAPVAPAPRTLAAVPPARRGHPGIALFCDRWKAHYGKALTINPKRIGILARIYDGLGPEASEEYPRLLDAFFDSTDRFIVVDNAHSPEVFQTKLDVLRVNGHGSPLSVLGKHGDATMRAGLEWIRQTSGAGAGS